VEFLAVGDPVEADADVTGEQVGVAARHPPGRAAGLVIQRDVQVPGPGSLVLERPRDVAALDGAFPGFPAHDLQRAREVLMAERRVARIRWQVAGPTSRRPLTAARRAGLRLARASVIAWKKSHASIVAACHGRPPGVADCYYQPCISGQSLPGPSRDQWCQRMSTDAMVLSSCRLARGKRCPCGSACSSQSWQRWRSRASSAGR
jgi:hypothetical protein